MKFNPHYELRNGHAFLSASSYNWLNYTPERLEQVFMNNLKKQEGTELHELASNLINKRVKVAKLKKAFNLFVNDAIGFGMQSEQLLYYSDNCFGTADAISFKDNILRIHDLKTGSSKVSFNQLDIYAALFCLEYSYDPHSILIIEQIYQGNDVMVNEGNPDYIQGIMDKIVAFDIQLNNIKVSLEG